MNSVKEIINKWSSFFTGGPNDSVESLQTQKKFLIIFYAAAIMISIFAVYAQVLSYPRYSPEWSLFYKWNYHLSLSEIVALYNPFVKSLGGIFYRPSSFIAFYQIVTTFIDWHNIFAFQVLGIVLFVINSMFIYYFAKQLFKDAITPLLTSVLSFIHPVFFVVIHNLFMMDFLYQIFILWFCILFCGNFLERKNAPLSIIGALLLYVLAITSKEQAIGLSVFLAGFMALEFIFNRNAATLENKLFRNRLILSLLAITITIVYVAVFLISAKGFINAGEYRTGINFNIIINNILSGTFWLSHIFVVPNKTWPLFRAHNTIINNIYGFMLLSAVIYYIYASVTRKDRDAVRTLLALLFFIIAFMLLPVYSGGRPWHFALPAVAFIMIYSRFVSTVLEKVTRRAVWIVCLCIVVIVPLILAGINFSRDMNRVDDCFKLNTEALLHPPLPSSSIPSGSYVAYYPAEAKWLYGCGYMFSFVYKRNDIIEIPVPDMDRITPEAALDLLSKDNLFYFEYDKNRQPIWEDKSSQFKASLLEKIPQGKRPPSMTGKTGSTRNRR